MMKRQSKTAVFVERLKTIFGLLMMAGMAYVFTHYLDADIGVVVCAFLILAPLISAVLAKLASNQIHAEFKTPDYLTKGRHFQADVTFYSKSKLPIPFVRLELKPDLNFVQDDSRTVQSAMIFDEPVHLEIGMTAKYAGCGYISVDTLTVSDYLGLFTFPVRNIPDSMKIGVIPAIPSLTGAGVMLHTVSDAVLTMDEEEEETSASFTSQTTPGYIHRDYIPGDNLKRINWKLSAKRNRLMVRMDESASAVRPALVFDFHTEGDEDTLKRRETLMEGALGFLSLLVKQGVPCSLRYASEGTWKCLILENEDAVESAAVELATADFRNDGNRIDLSVMSERAGAYLVYSTQPDAVLSEQLKQLHDKGYVACVVTELPEEQMAILSTTDAVWRLDEDFAMNAVQK